MEDRYLIVVTNRLTKEIVSRKSSFRRPTQKAIQFNKENVIYRMNIYKIIAGDWYDWDY